MQTVSLRRGCHLRLAAHLQPMRSTDHWTSAPGIPTSVDADEPLGALYFLKVYELGRSWIGLSLG
jgi:hypothetical protein